MSDTPRVTLAPELSESSARALGHDEQSLAAHGIAGLGRTEYSCRNAVAQRFQCWADGGELSVDVPDDVFAEDKIRPALCGDPADFGSEEPLACGSSALSGDAVFLTGIA